jgi:hypothetical protein
MRKALSILAVGALAVAASALLVSAEDVIMIDDCANKKSPVSFPHEAHKALAECSACHHTQEGLAEGGEAEPCASCHNEPEDAATPKCSEMSLSKNHYHINCIKCHKDAVKENAESKAPTKCDGCHPKAG